MNRGLVRVQIAVFSVIAILILAYAAVDLLGVRVVDKPYRVSVQLSTAGGIFEGAEVTYRGVRIGTISEVRLGTSQVTIEAAIDHGERVPASATATVRRLSAVGEQYLDFSSPEDGGPYLQAGSVVPVERTAVPPETAVVLSHVEALIRSVDPADLSSLSRELGAALGGGEGDLTRALTASQRLLDEVNASPGSLRRIVGHGATLLAVADGHRQEFARFSQSVEMLSRTLKSSTPALTRLSTDGLALARLAQTILREDGKVFALLMGGAADLTSLQTPYLGNWRALLRAVPEFERRFPLVIGDGTIRAQALFDYHQPVCSFVGQMTSPLSRDRSPLRDVMCTDPAPGTLRRGAQTMLR